VSALAIREHAIRSVYVNIGSIIIPVDFDAPATGVFNIDWISIVRRQVNTSTSSRTTRRRIAAPQATDRASSRARAGRAEVFASGGTWRHPRGAALAASIGPGSS
jgi:hypothetical protein